MENRRNVYKVIRLIIIMRALLPLLLLLLPMVMANSVATAEIKLHHLNQAPSITDIQVPTIYPDSIFECTATIHDENPQLVTLQKVWFVNGKQTFDPQAKVDDEVTCQLTAIDQLGASSETLITKKIVQEPPIKTKMLQVAMQGFGVKENTNNIEELGLSGMTGRVVQEADKTAGASLFPIVAVIIIISFLLTLNVTIRRTVKRPT